MSLYRRHVIEGSEPGPRLLILAGVHGDECEPMVAVSRLRREIAAEDLRGRLTLIPVANESAYRRLTRVGEDGLDLARTFPGNSNGSVTERLASELTDEIRNADYLIDLHTGGMRLDILPMTGFMLHADSKILDQQRRIAEAFDLPIVWGTSATLEGRSLSAARDVGVPAIYAEYGGGGGFRNDTVAAYESGCVKVMAALEMIELAPFCSRVQRRIDDWGADSGHLQVCHCAPIDGVFVPGVELGTRVIVGQEIGRIVDLHSGEHTIVPAEKAGLVLTLYSFPHVERGTGLCVIIDIDPAEEE